MEAKLNESIASRDWYTAHQLLISLGQRHQRAKRYEESKSLLSNGLAAMYPTIDGPSSGVEVGVPLATVADIALKYVEVCEASPSSSGSFDQRSVRVFEIVLAACASAKESDEKHSSIWSDVSSKLLSSANDESLTAPFFEVILASHCPADWKASWAVENVAGNKDAWPRVAANILKTDVDGELMGEVVMHLLVKKAFASATCFLQTILSGLKASHGSVISFSPIDDSTGSLPSFLCLLDSPAHPSLSLLNAAQIAFVICQRKSPPRILFTSLRDQFKLQGELAELVDVLCRIYSPQPKKAAGMDQMNPLASMFQNMFSGGGMPGGFPGMGAAQPPSAKKASGKKPGLDLD